MIRHNNNCVISNLGNGIEAEAEVINFEPDQKLTVMLAGNRIMLTYNQKTNKFVGSALGMDFASQGPKYYNVKQGRY